MELPRSLQTSEYRPPVFISFLDGFQNPKTLKVELPFIIGVDFFRSHNIKHDDIHYRHAVIENRPFGIALRDLRSTTGTYLNGNRILDSQILNRDRIYIGPVELIVHIESENKLDDIYQSSSNRIWREQANRIPLVAKTQYPVLITGPSGTGKEHLAKLIHQYSKRSRGPFISINCSALAENLAESELFGHIKGSFTGAQDDRAGAFQAAHGGTLFLDEIGDMPMSLQPKLLRALENNEVKPVGSDLPTSVDVRIVAATNRELRLLVAKGRFRQDLFYRLHILQFQIPALTERMEDFDNILNYYSKPLAVRFTQEALQLLKTHSWPGNVRELKNTVSRASALYPRRAIGVHEIQNLIDMETMQLESPKGEAPRKISPRRKYLEIERLAIIEKLMQFNGNQRQAARALDMPRSTLNDRIKRYNIDAQEFIKFHENVITE